ncbi:MAG TPA: glycosyltransferase family 4 protein, partial [Nitrospirae bacterium]|nr:glycosyltransferase family 4 protein [Nitrospirota bacterium]
MKIGINGTFLNNSPTGVGIFTKEVSKGLCNQIDTILYSPFDIGACKRVQTDLSISGSTNIMNNFKRLLYINTKLPSLIKRDKITLLYCPIVEMPSIMTRIPLVVTVHDLHPIYFKRQFGLSSLYFQFMINLLPKRASMVTVPSRFVREELLKYSKVKSEKIEVIYNGYDDSHFKPMDKSMRKGFLSDHNIEKPYILFVGSLFEYKNLAVLIQAFMSIKDKIEHNLLVIGKRDVAINKPIEDERIKYLDYVSYDSLSYFYSYADVFVHPAFFEGFGLAVLEAMACGTAVISS